jgi:6-pyruvoyl-tetrahydropterin synthase
MRPLMNFEYFLALAQKTVGSPPYGQGHNCRAVVTVRAQEDPEVQDAIIRAVVARLDHKSLGVDVRLDSEPWTVNLARWLAERLTDAGLDGLMEVRLERGDGFTVACSRTSRR